MNEAPIPSPSPSPPVAPASRLLGVVLAGVAMTLLLGGILQALASADARAVDGAGLFLLLAQAANPFVAFLGLAAVVAVVRARTTPGDDQAAPRSALALGAVVSAAVVLLALNGILIDLTGETDGGGLLRLSAVVSRLGAIALSAFALYLAATTPPAPPPAT